jgi:sorbitol-specific phosphotransferase system component IIA
MEGDSMRTVLKTRMAALAVLSVAVATACSNSSAEPTALDPAALLSVVPVGGTLNVSVGTDVVITFNHAMPDEMMDYMDLHEGTVTGPEVDGAWSLSDDHMVITFAPASALKPATTYVIHVGGDMMDEDGDHVDLEMHGLGMGGQWATQSMMSGGMMGGQTGSHMGSGWLDPDYGTYGMIFTFTTAG